MVNLTNEENWAARERLRRVEFLLWWRGWVGRGDLTETFGISSAQASSDLQRYAELNPGAMLYHTSRKRYEAVAEMVCRLHEPVFDEAVRVFLGGGSGIAGAHVEEADDARVSLVRMPVRVVEPGIARRLLVALLERRVVRVRYRSVNSGVEAWRELAPQALGWDGRRWHARAWCFASKEWRDFVPGRMAAAEWPIRSAGELPPDVDWETMETLVFRINPKLNEARREALRVDYGLAGDSLELRVRRAMKPYLLASMFIDHKSHRDLPRHFVLEE